MNRTKEKASAVKILGGIQQKATIRAYKAVLLSSF